MAEELKSPQEMMAAKMRALAGKFHKFSNTAAEDIDFSTKCVRLPSLSLNASWGGGLYLGRIHLFHGKEHSGKSTVATHCTAAVQTLCRSCLSPARSVDITHGMDPATLGLKTEGPNAKTDLIWKNKQIPTFQRVARATANDDGSFDEGFIWSWYWRNKTTIDPIVVLKCQVPSTTDPAKTRTLIRYEETSLEDLTLLEDDGEVLSVRVCQCFMSSSPFPICGETPKTRAMRDMRYKRTGTSYEQTTALYLDLENKVDVRWITRQGIDVDTLEIASLPSGEDVVDVVSALIDENVFDIIVVDSIEMMEPDEMLEASAHDAFMASGARLVNRALRQWTIKCAYARKRFKCCPTVILINQERKDMKGNTVLPKGEAQRFMPSSITKFFVSEFETSKDEGAHVKNVKEEVHVVLDSVRINFNPSKCCAGPPRRLGSFTMAQRPIYAKGKLLADIGQVFDHKFVYQSARTYGIIRGGSGAPLEYVDNGEVIKTFRIEADAKEAFITDDAMYQRVREQTLKAMLAAQTVPMESGV